MANPAYDGKEKGGVWGGASRHFVSIRRSDRIKLRGDWGIYFPPNL